MRSELPLTKQAYDYIQGDILAGRLAAGSQISEKKIAEQLRISRTPVGDSN